MVSWENIIALSRRKKMGMNVRFIVKITLSFYKYTYVWIKILLASVFLHSTAFFVSRDANLRLTFKKE